MFLDEARLVGALHHQNIAPIFEVDQDSEGRYFLVMDYVHGETAEAVWRRAGETGTELPLAFAITVVSAIASALDYAHSLCTADGTPLDIVHRDVSPSNVMVGYEGAVKLIDFGIAKSAHRSARTLIGTLKGKLGYLAPEQVLRRPLDHRTDIFALGIVLYELTTRTRAFDDNSELLVLERTTQGQVALPSQVVKDYPRALELIVMRALAVDPAQRYQSAAAMKRDLDAFAAKQGLALGDGVTSQLMRELFDRPHPGGRRRLARASEEQARVLGPPSADAVDSLELPTERHAEALRMLEEVANDVIAVEVVVDEDTTDPIEIVTP
jgi:serine/threonine-protein kinase